MEPHDHDRESRQGFLGRLAMSALLGLVILPIMGDTVQAGQVIRWRRTSPGAWGYGYSQPGYGYGSQYRPRFYTIPQGRYNDRYRGYQPLVPPVYGGYPGYSVPRGFQFSPVPWRPYGPAYPMIPPMM